MLLKGDTADTVAVIDDDLAANNRVPRAQIRRPLKKESISLSFSDSQSTCYKCARQRLG